ncbi:unnamed protein product, partial [Sphagnum tenellum]
IGQCWPCSCRTLWQPLLHLQQQKQPVHIFRLRNPIKHLKGRSWRIAFSDRR